MENLDIFVFAHSDLNTYPTNDSYKIVLLDDIELKSPLKKIICDREKDDILKLEHSYSEGARLHYIYKNIPLKQYVGTSHYRRYFEFFDDIPDMDAIFAEHDAILPKFDLGWPTIYSNYEGCHNIKDLNTVLSIIQEHYPEYFSDSVAASADNVFYPCNIFILKKEMFIEYCDFVFGVLKIYDETMGFKSDLDVYNWVVNHIPEYCNKGGNPNCRTDYQSRIQAFLMERLSTFFFIHKIKNPYMTDIVLTEVHDDFEKTYFKQYEK